MLIICSFKKRYMLKWFFKCSLQKKKLLLASHMEMWVISLNGFADHSVIHVHNWVFFVHNCFKTIKIFLRVKKRKKHKTTATKNSVDASLLPSSIFLLSFLAKLLGKVPYISYFQLLTSCPNPLSPNIATPAPKLLLWMSQMTLKLLNSMVIFLPLSWLSS